MCQGFGHTTTKCHQPASLICPKYLIQKICPM
jgi:hypothetical protein